MNKQTATKEEKTLFKYKFSFFSDPDDKRCFGFERKKLLTQTIVEG